VRKIARAVTVVGLLFVGAILGLYGVFDIIYTENGSDSAYVSFGGRQVDADIVGALSLGLAFVFVMAAILTLRREKGEKRLS
jgi:hypothetical protein